jgi:hypothetical protein
VTAVVVFHAPRALPITCSMSSERRSSSSAMASMTGPAFPNSRISCAFARQPRTSGRDTVAKRPRAVHRARRRSSEAERSAHVRRRQDALDPRPHSAGAIVSAIFFGGLAPGQPTLVKSLAPLRQSKCAKANREALGAVFARSSSTPSTPSHSSKKREVETQAVSERVSPRQRLWLKTSQERLSTDELDRANDVVIKLLELIGRYPLLAMRRSTNLGASGTSLRTTNRRENAGRDRSHFSAHSNLERFERRH